MSLVNLRSFLEVFRSRSISAAARNLDLTQPSVSGHIASLEAQVGRALFVRQARGVAPTPFAVDLAAQLGDSLDRAEEALAKARARSEHVSGVVHVAGPAELMAERMAPVLTALNAAGLEVRVHLGGRQAIYDKLLGGDVDLALTASTPDHPQLAWEYVGSERLRAVVAPHLSRDVIRAGHSVPELAMALKALPLLSYDVDRPLVRAWLRDNGLAEQDALPVITAPDLRLLRALVEQGAGWSVLPDYLASPSVRAGRLSVIPAPVAEPENPFHLTWAKVSLRHPRVARARDVLLAGWGETAL